jgi:hypothetical protein
VSAPNETASLASRFEFLNVHGLRRSLDRHNHTCPVPARAILLNPVDHELLGFDELWGLPVLADERVPVKRGRVDCEGSAWLAEEELQALLPHDHE